MNVDNTILTLSGVIQKNVLVLKRIEDFYTNFIQNELKPELRKTEQAIVISDLICNYYTCLETIFLRISQFFENNLKPDKWHQDLLQKMTIRIKTIRPAVISDETYPILLELLKFRHFKRYYFEFNYDWDKLEFIQKKFKQLSPFLYKDLEEFEIFLQNILESA